ncbi:patatin-like phospholipase family protein [Fibrella forsythiae]|uniref:Patatin-like phospholipase family protein n=1 Tax=Fibrella forsythiae TaxID=2817061 RepID=A0ABS3JB83_9BACT|nr:patatin-like phospholipase family protein [Fibrella forsythiae]MBO0947229.1 patatin-like phospholipase family protein [Fibrella forsythiae]
MKNILVLSGGAFKGAFQVGALRVLKDAGIKWDYTVGISTGALQGLLTAMDAQDRLEALWEQVAQNGAGMIYTSELLDQVNGVPKVSFKKVYNMIKPRLTPKLIWQLLSEKGRLAIISDIIGRTNTIEALADNQPLQDLLLSLLNEYPLVMPSGCGAVSLYDSQYYFKTNKDFSSLSEYAKFVKASASMPMVWKSTNVTGGDGITMFNLVDGGIRNISPLGDAISFVNAQEDPEGCCIWTINTQLAHLDTDPSPTWPVMKTGDRALDIVLSEVITNDIDQFMEYNSFAQQAAGFGHTLTMRNGRSVKAFKSMVIEPTESLGGSMDASAEAIKQRIKHGMERAYEVLSSKATTPFWPPQ